jgi:HAD superfamily hydrolase (TIGR01484 family)
MAKQYQFLLSFDFDGTLIMHESSPVFHPEMNRMLAILKQQGAAFVINTGRNLEQTIEGIAQYGVLTQPDFIIARECDIYKPGILRSWVDFGSWNAIARKDQLNFNQINHSALTQIQLMTHRETQANYMIDHRQEHGIIAQTEDELTHICQYIDSFKDAFPTLDYNRNSIYLRFTHHAYNKGTALRELQRLLNLTLAQTFAAGDNYNDLSMLTPTCAKMLACPVNSVPDVIQRIRSHNGFISTQQASEGMMQALHHYFKSSH